MSENDKFCYHHFVISSKNLPVYDKISDKRRILFQKYNLPYSILINDMNPYLPLQADEILCPRFEANPYQCLKFIHAVKLYFRSFPRWENVPQYIIRTNASVYIHYPSLLKYLETLPKERVLAGPVHFEGYFIVGMVMIFSKDVLRHIIDDSRLYEPSMMEYPDDVSLSLLAQTYIDKFIDMMPFFMYPGQEEEKNGIYNLEKVEKEKKWLYRIRFDQDRNYFDLQNWKNLMALYDDYEEEQKI